MIRLNFNVYPLVVGQLDKFTFSDFEKEGGSILLEATLTETEFCEADIFWTSSDESVAVVEDGKVRALRTGITDINATLPDGEYATCRIQVIDNIGRLTVCHVKLNADHLTIASGEGAALYPMIQPTDYFDNGMLDKTFVWTSSDESVAVVDHRGRIFAKSVGKTIITAVSMDVGRVAACEIDVVTKTQKEIYADPLEDMDGGQVLMNSGESFQLILPEDVADQPVCWCSENESIVSVDKQGLLTSNCVGSTKLWATFVNGGRKVVYDVCVESNLRKEVSNIVLNTTSLHLAAGERSKLYAIVFPATVLEQELAWESSDEQVIRIVNQHINLSGLDEIIVEAVGAGNALITGTFKDRAVVCDVSVAASAVPIKAISLPDVKLDLEQVSVLTPDFNLGLEEATNTEVVWLCDDRKTLTVDKDGVIKAYEIGRASVYCIAKDSMSEKAVDLYHKLADMRSIVSDSDGKEQLTELLSSVVYGKSEVYIETDSISLTNLHIPEETITYESVSLLWNRKALIDTEDFFHYKILDNGNQIGETDKLSFTVKGLLPETSHLFEVIAVSKTGKEICRKQLKITTKTAPTVRIDVIQPPYNAVGNGIALDTDAIQGAIDDCPEGGEVLLPKGYVFHSGALFLKSNMTFRVDGILFGSQNPEDYPYVVCRWEGYRKLRLTEENYNNTYKVFDENVYSYSSLVNVGVYDEGEAGKLSPYHTFDVRICGEGMINGNGFSLSYNQGPCWFTLRKGLPIPQSPVKNQDIRGRAVAFYNTRRAYVSDVTIAYSPSWTVHAVFSDQITFDNLKVISKGNGRTGTTEGMHILNGDGIDPDSSTNINIVDCYFTVGDDAVAIKSGRNREGNELAKPSAYIRITDCTCIDSKGCFAVGSETAGGVHDVLFQNIKIKDIMHFGLWIKSAPCRGGLIEDILFRDCSMDTTGGAFQIEYYHGGDEYPSLTPPLTRRVAYENIYLSGEHKFGTRIMGISESQIYDVNIKGCTFAENFEAKKAPTFTLTECYDIRIEDTELPEGYEWE